MTDSEGESPIIMPLSKRFAQGLPHLLLGGRGQPLTFRVADKEPRGSSRSRTEQSPRCGCVRSKAYNAAAGRAAGAGAVAAAEAAAAAAAAAAAVETAAAIAVAEEEDEAAAAAAAAAAADRPWSRAN